MATSLGCHVKDVAMPKCCPHDPRTTEAGSMSRFVTKGPTPNRRFLRRLAAFVKKWCKKNLIPLAADTDLGVELWLSLRPYPAHRRAELLQKWLELGADDADRMLRVLNEKKFHLCKSFMKDENYVAWKHARAINSRTDEFKCAIGPLIGAIEHIVYQNPAFIKHVPVRDRAKFIYERLYRPGASYAATDYTAFESLFTKEVMEACEFVLYEYMCQHLPAIYMSLLNVLKGYTVCEFKNFKVKLEATRMSGEMNTSLGNGFSNLMFMLFMAELKGMKNVVGVVEGDDGLFVGDGQWPSEEDFQKLGLIIKMEIHEELNSASFCGLIFDLHDQMNVTDPIEVVCSFGWTTRQYARSKSSKLKMLLRAKSLSLAYQYPGCPVIQELALYGLRMTKSYDLRHYAREGNMSMWDREQLLEALSAGKLTFPEPGIGTRELVARKFGLDISDQLSLEEYFRSKNDISPIDHPAILSLAPKSWLEYSESYAFSASPKRTDLESPPFRFSQFKGFAQEWEETRL